MLAAPSSPARVWRKTADCSWLPVFDAVTPFLTTDASRAAVYCLSVVAQVPDEVFLDAGEATTFVWHDRAGRVTYRVSRGWEHWPYNSVRPGLPDKHAGWVRRKPILEDSWDGVRDLEESLSTVD